MKGIFKIAVTAALVAGASADAHRHHHRQFHTRRMEKRDADASVLATAYVDSNGVPVSAAEAEACISDGECIVVGTAAPAIPSSTTSIISSATLEAAVFFESSTSSSSSSVATSTYVSTSSSSSTSSAAATSSTAASSTSSSSSSSSSTTVDGTSVEFPNGTVPCSTFPSEYGAVAVDWLDNEGWVGVQNTGFWTEGVSFSSIVELTSGGCTSGSFCSYACQAGQSKAQWPTTSQGSTGQSIGGLYCNSDGYLERTNPNFTTLCQSGMGGITIQNDLDELVSVCGTNYPGNENMNIPLLTNAGASSVLNNINAKTAYIWEGSYTSGQFYVNNKGVTLDQACVWTSTDYPDSAGNWAPVNIGAGTDIYGVTYISIFPNTPTSTAELDFDIIISGDISADCYLKSGSYYGGSSGCTVRSDLFSLFIPSLSSDLSFSY